MTHTKELQETQEAVKRAVNEGRMTKEEGISICLNKAIELLQSLKMPEGFTTEEQFMKDRTFEALNIN
jgi:hypothetical protein